MVLGNILALLCQSSLAGTALRLGSAGPSMSLSSALFMTSAQNKSNFFLNVNCSRCSQSWMQLTVPRPLTSLAFGELCLRCQLDEVYIRPKQVHKISSYGNQHLESVLSFPCLSSYRETTSTVLSGRGNFL